MAFLKGLFSRPTKEEQQAVDWAAANMRKSGEDVGFAKVKGTEKIASYAEEHGGMILGDDRYMMRVKETPKNRKKR